MEKLIIANWKSHKSLPAASHWVEEFASEVAGKTLQGIVVVAPPFTLMQTAHEAIDGFDAPLLLSAQDVSPYPFGAYTGEVTAAHLKELGVQYVILGHSERRSHFHETSHEVAAKVGQALEQGITPIVCVDRDYIQDQASAIERDNLKKVVVAYEPLSAIGTGRNEDVGSVKAVIAEIKQVFVDVPVIYGGSVSEFNINEYLLVADGALVGSASLEAKDFAQLVTEG